MEQQHQHRVDTEYADGHRQAEVAKQLAHQLQLALLHQFHLRWQVLHGRQLPGLLHHFAQIAAIEFDGQRDIAQAVDTINLRGTAAHAELSQRRQRNLAITPLDP